MYVVNIYANAQLVHAGAPIDPQIVIGRSDDSDLVIADPSVSRRHLSIEVTRVGDQEVVLLRDLGSRNGVYVNSQRVSERVIAPGDTVRFGCCRLDVLRIERSIAAVAATTSETIVCRWSPAVDNPSVAGRLRALYSMALSLSDLEIPFMLEKAAEIVCTCIELDQLGLLLEGKRGMVLCTSWNEKGPCGKDEIEVDESLIRNCIRLAQPLVSNRSSHVDLGDDAGFAASVPLIASGRVLGALYCSTRDSQQPFSQEDVQFLTLVSCFVASGINHRWNLADAQKAAAKVEAILGSLNEGVIVCDREFRIFSVNHAARTILGRRSLVGESFDDAIRGFEHTFDPATIRATGAFDMRRPAGDDLAEQKCFRATVSSAAEENGRWLYVICLRDITAERREERMLLAFVNRMAHKLRTPLTVVKGVTSQLVDRRALDDDVRVMIERSSSEMETIVEQFVEFASLDHERTQVRATAVPVAARYLIEQAISLAGESISSSGLEIDVEYDDPDCEVRVMSDRMCRCFHQIIENASKFAGAGCRLKIGSRIDSNIVFRFEDNGPGIASDELARVFDLFHQIDRDDTGEVPGLGLGLWWVREIVRVHGGNVVLTSPVANRRGLRVDVVLPLKLLGSRDAAALSDETDGFETLHAAEIV